MNWIDGFLENGPDYSAETYSAADMQILLLKAGLGAGLPLYNAQDFAGMSGLLMSDPQLFAIATAALEGPHMSVLVEGTQEHVVIEQARIAMAASVVFEALADGAARVVLHGLDWPQLLWPVLVRAEKIYGVATQISRLDAHTIMVSRGKVGMQNIGPAQAAPLEALAHLEALAARDDVPSL